MRRDAIKLEEPHQPNTPPRQPFQRLETQKKWKRKVSCYFGFEIDGRKTWVLTGMKKVKTESAWESSKKGPHRCWSRRHEGKPGRPPVGRNKGGRDQVRTGRQNDKPNIAGKLQMTMAFVRTKEREIGPESDEGRLCKDAYAR